MIVKQTAVRVHSGLFLYMAGCCFSYGRNHSLPAAAGRTTLRWGDFSGAGKVTKSAPNTYGFGNSLTAPISVAAARPAQRYRHTHHPQRCRRAYEVCASTPFRTAPSAHFGGKSCAAVFIEAIDAAYSQEHFPRRIRRETLTAVRVTTWVDRSACEEPSRRRSLMELKGLAPVTGVWGWKS